jgi:hypothetical protein
MLKQQLFAWAHCGQLCGVATVALLAACSSTQDEPGTTDGSVMPSTSVPSPAATDASGMGTMAPPSTATVMTSTPIGPPMPTPTVLQMPLPSATGDTPAVPPSNSTPVDMPAPDPTGTVTPPTPTDMPTADPTGEDMPPVPTDDTPPAPSTEMHPADHCKYGYDPHPSDETMATDGYAEYEANGQVDTTVQPEVIEWMVSQKWQPAHFQWHNVRRCGGGLGGGFGMMPGQEDSGDVDVCVMAELPDENECQGGQDGYEFMAMHRHMITSLKSLWPKHTEQFEGWDVYPQSADDVPEAWRDSWSDWDATTAANFEIAQNVDQNMDRFADEGEFGQWLQCMQSGLHGALHFKWVRQQNQEHGLGNQYRNIDNYMFWKMHGWMDKVWEKYRVAKGLAPDEPKLVDEMETQCREMDALALLIDPELEQDQVGGPLPEESGVFHETVRPIFEGALNCAGCHGPQGPSGGVSLGGQISSADIVANLVDQTAEGTNMPLVAPGNPEGSWLYLKVTGGTADATCTGTEECKQAMPPTAGMVLSDAEKQAIYDWIEAGAAGP